MSIPTARLTNTDAGIIKQLLPRIATPWVLLLLFTTPSLAETQTPPASAIATAHPIATAAGHETLAAGGNAFDAAVAVSATLAVIEPMGSGLGGGGFWLLHRASDGFETMVDGRERAPLAATRNMYLDEKGEVVTGLSMDGPLAAAIPGQPAALVHIAERYGRLPLKKSLAPAIRAALNGFQVTEHYRDQARFRLEAMRRNPETAHLFLHNNDVPPVGHTIKQPALAATLKAIAKDGRDGFYRGAVAKKLLASVTKAGGIWSQRDFDSYQVVERTPIHGEYKGTRITSAAPPSSGGIALITMLNILSGYELEEMNELDRTHTIVEAMRRAYRDRAEYLGDPDFVQIPMAQLTHPDYASELRETIRFDRATPSQELKGNTLEQGGVDTTHFSILDEEGNRVAATLSINYPFGAAFVAPGTGVLLNDEMDDFSAKPGTPNAYGLVGAEANAIAPGKRPLSSMSPTFLESRDRTAILGTPGGSRIITMVLLGTLEFAAGNEPQAWVNRPRFHHQFLPDLIQLEPNAISDTTQQQLSERGHTLKTLKNNYGNMQALLWNRGTNRVTAASDPRGGGEALIKQHQPSK